MKKERLAIKLLVGAAVLTLIGGVLFGVDAFVGNPISSMAANRGIQEYVDQNYSSLGLEVGKASYNFKDGSYMAFARSATSVDTWFAIYYSNGQVQRDNYETYVLGLANTLDRLSEEYTIVANKIIADEFGIEENRTMVRYQKEEYVTPALEIDMKFDRSLPLGAEVSIRLDVQDTSLEGIADIFISAHQAFLTNGCYFEKYSLYAENDGLMVMVNEVTPQDIEDSNFVQLLEQAQFSGTTGISVFIKGGEDKE